MGGIGILESSEGPRGLLGVDCEFPPPDDLFFRYADPCFPPFFTVFKRIAPVGPITSGRRSSSSSPADTMLMITDETTIERMRSLR